MAGETGARLWSMGARLLRPTRTTATIRTKAALTLMQTWGYSRDKVKVLVNRVHRKSEVSIAEIEEVLGRPAATLRVLAARALEALHARFKETDR